MRNDGNTKVVAGQDLNGRRVNVWQRKRADSECDRRVRPTL